MRQILLITVLVVILLGGLVVAQDRTLYDASSIDVPLGTIYAGSDFEVNFSFKYLNDFANPLDSPLIIRLNITSDNDLYPVWRNDFEVSGRVKRFALWGFVHIDTVYFDCNDSEVQIIDHRLDSQTVVAGNGTFYCYNSEGELQLEEYDEVYLNITPNQVIFPGKYDLSAEMFYLTDERLPFVNITNKHDFEGRYYREIDNIVVRAEIDDASGINQQWSSFDTGEVVPIFYDHFDNGEYYFSRNIPIDVLEGDYPLSVFAEDSFGNIGNDSTVLMIDRTGPEIELLQPVTIIGSETFFIEVDVSDLKAGVDESSVEYRIREMNGTTICPESGVGSWDCFNSGWVLIPMDVGGTYIDEINVTDIGLNSGEYWLDFRAMDILGNMGVL